MKRTGLIVMALLLSVATTFSQDMADQPKGKPTVYIDYFKRTNEVPFALSEGLRNHVISGVQKMQRVILIDVDSQEALHMESQRRSSENVSAGDDNEMDRLAVMNQLGAQYIITGSVSSATTEWKEGKEGKKGYYSASVSYALKVINPTNGTLVGSKAYKHSGTGGTKEDALNDACSTSSIYMSDFVEEHFKLEGAIIEVNAVKKGKAEEVYVNLGSIHGVNEGQRFEVFVVREVAGHTAKKEIGRLNTKAVEGETICLCKVTKGGEEIQQAFTQGSRIVVISRKPPLLSF